MPFRQQAEHFYKIEQALAFIQKQYPDWSGLDGITAGVHLSRLNLDRLCNEWAGVNAEQFLYYLTRTHTRALLSQSLTFVKGSGCRHDLSVNCETMTPAEYKKQAAGLTISYGISLSPFGSCLIGSTQGGICHCSFHGKMKPQEAGTIIRQNWPRAELKEDTSQAESSAVQMFQTSVEAGTRPLHLLLKGTGFQIQVWQALLRIPRGKLVSYSDIAAYIGKPKAVRAAAHAIAINPIAYLIPCHRIIAQSGAIHKYRWGSARKKAMIGWETAQA